MQNNRKKIMQRLVAATLKRGLLALAAAVVAISFGQTGRAASPCTIARGQDPLDVLQTGVRHNVWIVLDTSGSMGGSYNTGSKFYKASRTIEKLLDDVVDASGDPLVNWGFAWYWVDENRGGDNRTPQCADPTNGLGFYPASPNECKGLDPNWLAPPACGSDSPVSTIKGQLADVAAQRSSGHSTYTPNGLVTLQLGTAIGNGPAPLPNQKNFIILLTDGDDTCECSQFGWGGAGSTVPLRTSDTDPYYTQNYSDDTNVKAYNAGFKGREAFRRMNGGTFPATEADMTGDIFVIGLGLGSCNSCRRRANHLAWESSNLRRPAFFAEDDTLIDEFRNILAQIGVPESTVNLGAPTVGSVKEVIPSYTNTSVPFSEVVPPAPDGEDYRTARIHRAKHQGNVLFSSSVDVPSFRGHLTAHNVYTVTDPADPTGSRVADFTLMWDAGEKLKERSPNPFDLDARQIYFNRKGSTDLLPFDSANVTPEDLGVTDSDNFLGAHDKEDARDMIVGVIRGYRLELHANGTYYDNSGNINFKEFEADGVTKRWKLYDSAGTRPAVVGTPTRSPDYDPTPNHKGEYGVGGGPGDTSFYWDEQHFNRPDMVYVGSNSGMMHAFRAGDGEEVFAYIPDDVLGIRTGSGETPGSRDTLKDLVQLIVNENVGIANHKYYLAGPATSQDVFLRQDFGGTDDWATVLSFGRGRGGRAVSALDVTDPNNPKLRFNKVNYEGQNDGDYDGLGETWSTPIMGNVPTDETDPRRLDQWLLFLGGGYGCDNSNLEGEYIFALRVEDGSVYYRGQVSDDPNAVIDKNAVVGRPTLLNPHSAEPTQTYDYVSRLYVGDLQGRIWKLGMTDFDPNNWSLEIFAELGVDHPITAPISVLPDLDNQEVYVMAGTGGDRQASSDVRDFKFFAFVDKDAIGGNTTQYDLEAPFMPGTEDLPLWERTLPQGMRVFVAPAVLGNFKQGGEPVVFFAASRPEFDVASCTGKFVSSLSALTVKAGDAAFDLDPGDPGTQDTLDLGDNKVTGLYASKGNLMVSKSGGLGTNGETSVFGDGDFSDSTIANAGTNFGIQILVESFRVSAF